MDNYTIHIDSRILNLTSSRRIYNVSSVVLFFLAVSVIVFGIISKESEFLKFGFGIITLLITAFMQDRSLKQRNQISSLTLIKAELETSTLSNDIKEQLIKKAIGEI